MGLGIKDIEKKVYSGERLTEDDALALFETEDIFTLGQLANHVREKRHEDVAYYVKNMHLNYTNVCVHSCKFCGFARKPDEEGGWEMDLKQVFDYASKADLHDLTELHIVGGLNPGYPYEFYLDMLRGLKKLYPNLHLKAFTAVEIEFLSKISKKPIDVVLRELMEAGLDSLPGGGAEIFARRVWDEICGTKTRPEKWLEIHRTAHKLGLRSTCTMLYGHIETPAERVDHMSRLRSLQDETGGFTAFIPLAFIPEKTEMSHLPGPDGLTDLRVHAVARLFLDNIEHIKAYWIMTGPKMAQVLLNYGIDDLDGTIIEERIVHMAGATSPVGLTEKDLQQLIIEAGRKPVQRDSLYNQVGV